MVEIFRHVVSGGPGPGKKDLFSLTLTCKRFHRLSQDVTLWRRLDVSLRCLAAGSIGRMMERQVIVLRMARTEIRHPPILASSPATSPDFACTLSHLDLSWAIVGYESLAVILGRCRRLRKVSLEGVRIDNGVLRALATCVNLETVNMAMVEGFDLEGLTHFLNACRKIAELNIAWTYLRRDYVSFVATNLPPSVRKLAICGCRRSMFDKDVANIVDSCSSLRELDLSDNNILTGLTIGHLLRLGDLESLALSRCYSIPTEDTLYSRPVTPEMPERAEAPFIDRPHNFLFYSQCLPASASPRSPSDMEKSGRL